MCGIAGILTFNNSRLPFSNIRRMTQGMRHRGPDDEGYAVFHGPNSLSQTFGGIETPKSVYHSRYPFTPKQQFPSTIPPETHLALGHRRLAILDLSPAGHQPMCTDDGRYWIVYNGEIYNYLDIRNLLKKEGISFVGTSDTEVILYAYRQWGPECVKKFNGMWAFAIWDRTKRELFCSRDRIGIKPFYFYLTEHSFIFASDIKTLIASEIYHPEPDFEGLYHAMSFYCAPRPMTCFKGVKALEQGHWLIVDSSGNICKQKYYQLPVGEIDYTLKEDQWVNKLEGKLIEAVNRRLIADVPVGTFMSGGIDSTTVSAMAAQQHHGIKAFTLAFEEDNPDYNELPQAKATAKMWPMEHIYDIVDPETILENLTELVLCHEEPYYSLSPNFLVAQLVSKYPVPVILSGLGADELFCGYGRERFVNLWRRSMGFSRLLNYVSPLHHKLRKLHELSKLKTIFEIYIWAFSIFSEEEKKELFTSNKAKNWSSFDKFIELYGLDKLSFHDPIEAISYMDIINYIGNHHLYRLDQFTMHFSIEARFPMLDHEFVELSLQTPSSLKVRRKLRKYSFRKVAQKYIHPSCLKMKKKGFDFPFATWIKGPLKSLVEIKLRTLIDREIFHPDAVMKYFHLFNANKIGPDKLWQMVFIELWFEQFFEDD